MNSQSPLKNFQRSFSRFTFPGKRTDEEIIMLLRRHWIVFVFKLLPLLFSSAALIFFNAVGEEMLVAAGIGLGSEAFALIINFLSMGLWIALFIIWVNYYLDVWIVTDRRIIDIEQFALFRRRISEMEHSKTQDVTADIQGLIPTLFNYGHIHVQTAGEVNRFVFQQIPDPGLVKDSIMRIQQWAVTEEKKKEGAIMRGKY